MKENIISRGKTKDRLCENKHKKNGDNYTVCKSQSPTKPCPLMNAGLIKPSLR